MCFPVNISFPVSSAGHDGKGSGGWGKGQRTPGPCLGAWAGQLAIIVVGMLQSLSRELWTSRHQSIAYNVLIPLQPQLTAASAHSFLRFSPAPAVPLTGTFLTFLQFPCHSALFFVLKTVFHRPQASLSPQSLPPGHLSLPPCYGQWTLLLSAPQGVKVKVLVTQSCPAL